MGRGGELIRAAIWTGVAALVAFTASGAGAAPAPVPVPAATPGVRIAFVSGNGTKVESVDIGGGDRAPMITGARVAGEPSAGRAAVLRTVTDHLALWAVDVDGAAARQLDAGPANDIAVSPDGTRVAYTVRLGGAGDATEIRIVPLIGGAPIIVATSGTNVSPAWSRDSQRIAYIHQSALYTVAAAGGSPRLFLTPGHKIAHPSWAAGNDKIVYEDQGPGAAATAVGMVSAAGGDAHILPGADFGNGAHWPRVSPDGKWMAFVDDTFRLQVLPLTGTGGGVVARTATIEIPSFSWLDGTHLAVAAVPPSTPSAQGQVVQLAVVGVDASFVTVTHDAGAVADPVLVRAVPPKRIDRSIGKPVVKPRPRRNRVVAVAGLALMATGAGAAASSVVLMRRRRHASPPPDSTTPDSTTPDSTTRGPTTLDL